MSDDQFMKLFRYIEDFREEVNEKLDAKAEQADIDKILNILDQQTATLDDISLENAALKSSDDRLTKQIEQLAGEMGADVKKVAA
ncbi:hypothetical protein CR983_04065 [Candidatus Saccharibacteria bacterium]|nr:MAG: hypothetical protein CR983_04065 [Candidatus Saccharibacteria bacterium]